MPNSPTQPNNQQDDKFYETVGTATPIKIEAGADWEQTIWFSIYSWVKSKEPQTSVWLSDAGAALQDVWQVSRKGARSMGGRRARRFYRWVAGLGVIAGLALGTAIAGVTYTLYASDLSNPAVLMNKKSQGTTILDRNGEVLYQVYGANNRKPVSLEQMPKSLIDATIASEDASFYKHPGFSWQDTARALYVDVINNDKLQGGSTITQQLVKNALLNPEKSFVRKYQEVLLAVELERRYTKSQILEMYLNQVYYGQGSYGIESAAHTYFQKSAKDLTLAESAMLAGLPLGPSRYDPNLDATTAKARRDFVLTQMRDAGFITPEQTKTAQAEPLVARARQITIQAPHFVFYVLEQLRQNYGEDLVERGGITVYTTLDLPKQRIAEDIARKQVERLAGHHVTNAGLVAIKPKTGEVLAMVGSIDYNNQQFGKVNVTLSQLQPGSSFKPFAYATAFKKGWNGATQVDDKKVSYPQFDGSSYNPVNYDGKFRGEVLVRRALSNSLNIPAIHALEHAGIDETIKTAKDMGITSLNERSRYGLSLVLGGGEVRPLDMAVAFSTFSNLGTRVDHQTIIKVLDRNSHEITQKDIAPEQKVLDPRIAYMIINILSDNRTRSEIFGANSPLKLSRPAFVKTGTTNDFRDNWTVGATPDLAVAVWVGNNDHSEMNNVDGITGAAPIWNQFMERAHEDTPVSDWARPEGLVTASVCSRNGGLANPWDQGIEELFLAEAPQTKRCSSEAPKPKEENRGGGDAGKIIELTPSKPPEEPPPPTEPPPDPDPEPTP